MVISPCGSCNRQAPLCYLTEVSEQHMVHRFWRLVASSFLTSDGVSMRFLLIVSLVFAGGWSTTAISANSRFVTFMQKVLPSGMVSNQAGKFVAGAGLIGLVLCGTITGCERCQQMLPAVGGVEDGETVGDDSSDQSRSLGRFLPLVDGGVQDTQQLGRYVPPPTDYDFRAIPDHRDLGAKVNQLGGTENRRIQRWGEVIAVYDNGYYDIRVDREAYSYDGQHPPFQSFTMLIHQDIPWERGGFSIMRRRE